MLRKSRKTSKWFYAFFAKGAFAGSRERDPAGSCCGLAFPWPSPCSSPIDRCRRLGYSCCLHEECLCSAVFFVFAGTLGVVGTLGVSNLKLSPFILILESPMLISIFILYFNLLEQSKHKTSFLVTSRKCSSNPLSKISLYSRVFL